MLRQHLRYCLLVLVIVVSAITALNFAVEIGAIWQEKAAAGYAAGVKACALYVVCRLLDNTAQAFSVSLLLGLVWSEAMHARGGRLLMVRSAGLSFGRRASAAIILASAAVPLQFVLDNWGRPAAYLTLAHEGLGEFGWKYERDTAPVERWFAFGGTVMRAVVRDGAEPSFAKAVIYQFNPAGDLGSVVTAEDIVRDAPAARGWVLRNATRVHLGSMGDPQFGKVLWRGRDGAADEIGLAISPEWFGYRTIEPKYVPLPSLLRLASDRDVPNNAPAYAAWRAIRFLLPLVTGLLVVSVCALFAYLLDRRGLEITVGATLFFAYFGHFFIRVSSLVVENAPVSPIVSSLFLLGGLAALTLWLFGLAQRREVYREL